MNNNKLLIIEKAKEQIKKVGIQIKEKKKEQIKTMDTILEKTPFLLLINAGIGCGKTVMAQALIKRAIYLKIYERIFVVSPTINRGFWSDVGVKKTDQIEFMDTSAIKEMGDFRKKQQDAKKKLKPWLVVFDDLLSGDTKIKDLISPLLILRHRNISTILIGQHLKSIPPAIRSNAYFYILGNLNGHENHKILFQELCNAGDDKNTFINNYYENTKDNAFMIVNNTNVDNKDRINRFKVDMKFWGIKPPKR